MPRIRNQIFNQLECGNGESWTVCGACNRHDALKRNRNICSQFLSKPPAKN